ncbi:MAG: hypothetical protein OK454_11930, partial [Thaumarchaeota archaeon]|nr:hypothetical protein [Nitrososphaerota archaeon]
MQTSGSLRHARGLAQHSPFHSTQTRSASRLGGRKKLGAPLRQSLPTYVISPLVLDLEAEGNPYVRPYDEGDEAQQSALWAQRPKVDVLRARIADFRRELDDSQSKMKAVANDVFSPARLSEVDVL